MKIRFGLPVERKTMAIALSRFMGSPPQFLPWAVDADGNTGWYISEDWSVIFLDDFTIEILNRHRDTYEEELISRWAANQLGGEVVLPEYRGLKFPGDHSIPSYSDKLLRGKWCFLVVHRDRPDDVHSVWANRAEAIATCENLGKDKWALRPHKIT